MLKKISDQQLATVKVKFEQLLKADPLAFSGLTPSKIPIAPGVYVITAMKDGNDYPYYVGRTKNFQQRIYNNHLMGPLTNARLKKHLIDSGECVDIADAKAFIRNNCAVRWVEQEGFRERGALEGYATAILFPKYGIYEEH